MCTHLTPFTEPPLSTHSRSPLSLNARDTGNSPSDETGFPSLLISVGTFGLMEKSEIVFEPA